jgi:L-amino acid N-acyltransferase YncA
LIRPFRETDAEAVLAIWNPIIRSTTITFTSEEKTAQGLGQMIAARRSAGQEFFVAEQGGRVLGFATYAQFRAGNGYARAMEHTIILGPEAKGQGLGRGLMTHLEDHARAAGNHTLFAGVSGENAGGVAFHAAIGFTEIARIREVGRKFDRWLDLVLMQKIL